MEVTITAQNYDAEVVKSEKPVLLDFWAPWCGPCKMLGPVIAQIAEEHPEIKVGKVNVDEESDLAEQFGVMSIPTLVMMKEGKITNSFTGFAPKESIEELIKIEPEIIEKRPMTRRRGSSIGQTRFMKEIEEYVEQNMKEMYKAIEELRQSYEGEINEAVESGFEEIAESLRSDLKFEEENLTAQYEEERMKQIELIREKHKKK